ncbi:hypothetical protein PMIN06_005503 [Paraphaeosphaeria minitans]
MGALALYDGIRGLRAGRLLEADTAPKLKKAHTTKTARVEIQPTNVAETNCSHGLWRAGCHKIRPYKLGLDWERSTKRACHGWLPHFPRVVCFSVAVRRRQTWQNKA